MAAVVDATWVLNCCGVEPVAQPPVPSADTSTRTRCRQSDCRNRAAGQKLPDEMTTHEQTRHCLFKFRSGDVGDLCSLQNAGHFSMREDDVGVALQGVEVVFGETFAFL